MSLLTEIDVVVVGAGPAGLAVAACLQQRGIAHILLEKAGHIAPAWRTHYDRLHLHTNRALSSLPHFPMPRNFPKYPSRQQVVDYLEAYVTANRLGPQLGVAVEQISQENGRYFTQTSAGTVNSRAVVVATGYSHKPNIPRWQGDDTFPGTILHSSAYRSGAPFAGQDVLVVGFGNSGGEIALDLIEHGARPKISVRGPVNIIPRDVLGLPILGIAIPLSQLPPKLADWLSWPLLKLYYPSYEKLGLQKAPGGPFSQIAHQQRIPLLDIGTVRQIRQGRLAVVAEVQSFAGDEVRFVDGRSQTFQAVVLATGYRPVLPPILPTGIVPPDRPLATVKGQVTTNLPGLYTCGFYVSPTGMLREIGLEAQQIAALIAGE
ncbi:MAG: NAD(P)/FAD-dependent oxidoreductase [Anaerolineaceae bacterium]|nr:NAD(P)/FAD-dependent oxidoreductase [Anaerolineaceae bacterium]